MTASKFLSATFWIVMAVAIAVPLLSVWVLWPTLVELRWRIVARQYCYQLAGASEEEAEDWIERLEAEPRRDAKLRAAMDLLGKVSEGLDWWLLSTAMWRMYDLAWMEALNDELSMRPELSQQLLRVSRTLGMPHSSPGENMANWEFRVMVKYATEEGKEMRELWAHLHQLSDEGDVKARAYLLGYCIDLRLAWAACGYPEQGNGLTVGNLPERFEQWRVWWRTYENRLWFDEAIGHLVLSPGQETIEAAQLADKGRWGPDEIFIKEETEWRPTGP